MPSHKHISLLIATLLAGLLGVWGAVQATPALATTTGAGLAAVSTPTALPNLAEESSPDISAIDSPTPACTLSRPHSGVCTINWYYLAVNAAPQYVISMTVSIDSQPRARYSGFFQTGMYVPTEMTGFEVPCGLPGASGDPNWGASHSYTLRARDSSGLTTANYGAVYCPADEPLSIFMPLLRR